MKIKIQKPYCISTRHTQSYPRVSFVNYFKCRWILSDKPYMTENVFARPSYDPRGQNENSVSVLSAIHALSHPRVSVVYF